MLENTSSGSPNHFSLAAADEEIFQSLQNEERRQTGQLQLVASENFVSPAVRAAVASVLMNKFAEGYPGARYCAGCEQVDVIEKLAIERAKELFSADHANVQPHSGSQANIAAYRAVVQDGDTVLAMRLTHGGHLTHGAGVNQTGRQYRFIHYGVRKDTQLIDYEEVRELARRERPKAIVAGATAYPRQIDFRAFASIAEEVGAVLIADVAQYLGLIAGGVYESPLPHADIVTSTTYKAMRGPRGGLILCKSRFADAIDRSVFPGVQGGPHSNIIAAKAVSFREAATADFRRYAGDVIGAAQTLAGELAAHGFSIVTGGTDCHIVLVDLSAEGMTGAEAEVRLYASGISCNRNLVPFDCKPPRVTSGIRLGTAAMVTAGLKPPDFVLIARLVATALRTGEDARAAQRIQDEVLAMVDGSASRVLDP